MKSRALFGLVLIFIGNISFADEAQNKFETFKIERKTVVRKLHYLSSIQPIKKTSIITPAEGVIFQKSFEYGQVVKKGQPLFVVNSTKIESDYHTALTQYLEAKEKRLKQEKEFEDSKSLWKLGIVSRNEHESIMSSVHHAHVSYLRALYALNDVLKKGKFEKEEIKNLEISNIKEIEKALQTKSDHIDITASEDGIALLPPDNNNRRDTESGLDVGGSVKDGEVLTIIGDMTGASLIIKVNEVDIHDIKQGQKAFVTGVAFPKMILEAEVTHIDAQASTTMSGGGLPTFTVILKIKELNDLHRKKLLVGMSAKVRLDVTTPQSIEIPIKAVYEKDGQTFVHVVKNGKKNETKVEPGQTFLDNVEIIEGLNDGDVVVVPN